MSNTCLRCGGTGFLPGGKIACPVCKREVNKSMSYLSKIPAQYNGRSFNKAELPLDLQNVYGPWMENKLAQILKTPSTFQENFVIASRANSGKTVWSYNLITELSSLGYSIPTITDIMDIANIFHAKGQSTDADDIFTSRALIVKLPRMLDAWCYDMIAYTIDRRVRNNGFTIFLFPGSAADIEMQDKFHHLTPLLGDGKFNSLKIYSFYS